MTATLHLDKAHGLGNDFLVALTAANPQLDRAWADAHGAVAAKQLCDRHRGVGADGLILGLAPVAPGADVEMVLFNADGSSAEISGNGIRCLAQAVLRRRGAVEGPLVIDTAGGRRTLGCAATADPNVTMVSVDMGELGAGPDLAPSAVAYPALDRATAAVGNPHLVLRVDDLADHDPAEAGPRLEADVPGGINVHFLVVDGPDAIRLKHWERGAGVTEACGSGATVSAAIAARWGLVSSPVRVRMPGGEATVDVGDRLVLTGEAVRIAEIEVPDAWS